MPRRALLLAIANRQSTFGNSFCGGIAQLVERQLCKLDVRGSNPLASKASTEAWRQRLTKREDEWMHWRERSPLASKKKPASQRRARSCNPGCLQKVRNGDLDRNERSSYIRFRFEGSV
jgi:hypothetical protein